VLRARSPCRSDGTASSRQTYSVNGAEKLNSDFADKNLTWEGRKMPKTIMIVDDAMFMRVTLKNMLNSSGYQVITEACDGEDAVAKYAACRPDLVTMDITMPRMDGIQACRTIKAGDPSATIVMCTAMGQKNMVIEALQAGAKDFIVKPFKPEQVLDKIKKLLGE
jgi:two-component system chemotaxis response regulator CheY